MDIVYVVSSEGHFGSMSSEREREYLEREREYLVKLLGLFAGDGRELMSRGVKSICELGAKELSF